ncbi:MAG: hypothetical protein ACRDDZ_03935 [Marinifilaceae bacterium]
MNEEWFAQILSGDISLTAESYDSLTASLCKYPYFQLLLVNKLRFVKQELPDQYANLLKRYTVSIHNHKHYLLFLNGMTHAEDCNVIDGLAYSEIPVEEIKIEEEMECLSTIAVADIQLAPNPEQCIVPNFTAFDIASLLENTDTQEVADNVVSIPAPVPSSVDLIERFMREQPTMPKLKPETKILPVFENKEVDTDDELFSETLAKIYVKQGLYDKAITTYIKLSLKFPEKSVYFANRIEVIKEKINN